jgi:hypothetical protein
MSKGGNGGNGGTGDPGTPKGCANLTFETILNPLDEAILRELREGTTLQVRREIEQGHTLALCYWAQQRVGTITGPHLAELLGCIKDGQSYVATVSILDDGLVRVIIRPS